MYPGTYAQTVPDRAACIMGATGATVTYAELNERSNRVAQLLRSRGLETGDHIAIVMDNNPRYFDVAWGAQRSGLVYTAISSRLTSAEVEYIINDCGAKAVFMSAALRELAAGLGPDRIPAAPSRFMCDGTIDGWERFEAAVAGQPADRAARNGRGRRRCCTHRAPPAGRRASCTS